MKSSWAFSMGWSAAFFVEAKEPVSMVLASLFFVGSGIAFIRADRKESLSGAQIAEGE